jgi:membrane protein DedA with SNARE-associated domain
VSDLPGVFGAVEPYLDDYGYAAIGVMVLLENVGVPVPGEAAVITGALFAVAGRLDLTVVALVAFLAAVVGDNLGYAIGRFGGRRLVQRVGISPEHLDRVEGFFARHGAKVVVAARFLPLLRHLNGIAAGVSRMAWRRFLLANAAGAAIWAAVWVAVGTQAGKHIDAVSAGLERSTPVAAVLLVLGIVALVVRRRRRKALVAA